MARDFTANARAVQQYEHLMAKEPAEGREVCLGLLGMDPPPDFRAAIKAALDEHEAALFGEARGRK